MHTQRRRDTSGHTIENPDRRYLLHLLRRRMRLCELRTDVGARVLQYRIYRRGLAHDGTAIRCISR
jgi:hypothetical protein